MEPKHFLTAQNTLGEGPIWHPEEERLYWVDIEEKKIHSFDPETNTRHQFQLDKQPGALGLRRENGFVIAVEDAFAFWDPQENKLTTIAGVEEEKRSSRINDAKIDSHGRFWGGTMTQTGSTSSIYTLETDLSVSEKTTGITISNGFGWSPDNTVMYHADSLAYVINSYDFDPETGSISNKRIFFQSNPEFGIPDGLTVDLEGAVWCAFWGGSKICRISAAGNLLQTVSFPVSQPTSCIFGGENYETLFITSARTGLSPKELATQPMAGNLFILKTDIGGRPEPYFCR